MKRTLLLLGGLLVAFVACAQSGAHTVTFNFKSIDNLEEMHARYVEKEDIDLTPADVMSLDGIEIVPSKGIQIGCPDPYASPVIYCLFCRGGKDPGKLLIKPAHDGDKITRLEMIEGDDCTLKNFYINGKDYSGNANERVWTGKDDCLEITPQKYAKETGNSEYYCGIEIRVMAVTYEHNDSPNQPKTIEVASVQEFNDKVAVGDRVLFTAPLRAVFQSNDGLYTYLTTDESANMLLYSNPGLSIDLARDDHVKAGLKGIKSVVDGEVVLEPDVSTVKKEVEQAIHAKLLNLEKANSLNNNDFVYSLGMKISTTSTPNTFTMTDEEGRTMTMVNRFDINVLTGNGNKFLGMVGNQNGEKVIYPTFMTLPTGTITPTMEALSWSVRSSQGHIIIDGEWTTVDVFDSCGRRIACNRNYIDCPAGTYVVIVDHTPQKIIVK